MGRARTREGSNRRGFTLVELAIVLTIASILIGVALPRITGAFQQRDVTGVRDSVILLAARARANAMERAQTTRFELDVTNGVAQIVGRRRVVAADSVLEILRYTDDRGVATTGSPALITLCYTPRGFATQPCSTALGGPTEIVFSRMGYEATIEIWQLGQVRKL